MIPTQTNVDKASSQAVYHDKRKRQDRGQFLQGELTMNEMDDTNIGIWPIDITASLANGQTAVM